MKTETRTRNEYRRLLVKGTFWNGTKGQYEYPIISSESIGCLADVRRIAGDFQTVTKAFVVRDVIVTTTTLSEITV